MAAAEDERPLDFIRELVARDLAAGKYGGRVVTRFPPEPNGYLHIGHAKAICLELRRRARSSAALPPALRRHEPGDRGDGVRRVDPGATCAGSASTGARTSTSPPTTSSSSTSYACELIQRGRAFVCDLSSEEIARAPRHADRARHAEPVPRPLRRREPRAVRSACAPASSRPGARVLRAKIDMASSVLPMRDPILYRISTAAPHHRTGRDVVRSTRCTTSRTALVGRDRGHHALALHARVRRPPPALRLGPRRRSTLPQPRPRADRVRARERLAHRDEQARAPAARRGGARARLGRPAHADARRACAAAATRPRRSARFWTEIGVARRDNLIELARLEAAVREELNRTRAARAWRVLRPLKARDRELPGGREARSSRRVNNPEDPAAGTRKLPFSRELWIERDDFMEDAAEEVPPPRPGPRGAAALRLLRHAATAS